MKPNVVPVIAGRTYRITVERADAATPADLYPLPLSGYRRITRYLEQHSFNRLPEIPRDGSVTFNPAIRVEHGPKHDPATCWDCRR